MKFDRVIFILLALLNIAVAGMGAARAGSKDSTPRVQRITPTRQHNPQQFRGTNRDPGTAATADIGDKLLPLDLRSISDWKLTDLLLISDIDGNLHGVERNTGSLLWTLPINDPLVKISTNTSDHIVADGGGSNVLWFVEPYLDGSLYYFTPKFGLNQLPTSIKNLVLESPFSLSGDDKIYTGSRRTSLYTINIFTGEVTSSYGNNDDGTCPVSNIHRQRPPLFNADSRQLVAEEDETIMIGKTTYELSIFLKENTNVVWNVTYSQWGPNNIDNDLIIQNQQSLDKLYFTPFHDKSLLGINKDLGTPVWISRLPSLAVNVFDIFQSSRKSGNSFVCLPHPLKVLNDLQLNEDNNNNNQDLVFINKTVGSNEWFAMSYQNYPTLIKSAPVSLFQTFLNQDVSSTAEYDQLRNLQVSGNLVDQREVEKLLNGIHKVFRLNSETFYQPHLRWDDEDRIINKYTPVKQIGGNTFIKPSDGLVPITISDHDLATTGVPSIMEGIWFPQSNANRQKPHSSELLLLDGEEQYPVTTSEAHQIYEVEDTTSVKSLNLIKRICEDIIVILVLLVLLMSFGRMSKFTKQFAKVILGRDTPRVPEINITSETSQKPESKDEIEALEEKIENKAEEVEITKELTSSSDSSEVPVKKVSIVVPGQDPVDPLADPLLDEDGHDPNSKKKRKRGSRGGKRAGKGKKSNEEDEDVDSIVTTSLIKAVPLPVNPIKKLQIENNLILSDKILGYGSHGTVVFQGTFENRPVAVKRMLLDFFDIASHEVRLLQESDDHANVIRYFCSQLSELEKFLYIALELCLCSLEDIIEKPGTVNIAGNWKIGGYPLVNGMLLQLASGLHYLHLLKIVHRDLKPQNILVGDASKKSTKNLKDSDKNEVNNNGIRLLISDFGLCKKLDADQSSFRATTQHAALGTSGWRAPELLLHHDLLEISPETIGSINSQHGTNHSLTNSSASNGNGNSGGKRLTKAIDIFSLGCVYFYILTGGNHPFGDRYLREGNIIKGEYDLSILVNSCPLDKVELMDLISSMINHNPRLRPDTHEIMKHPFFWSTHKKLEFLLKVSDRFEIERRDPPSDLLLKLEDVSLKVCNLDWHSRMDEEFLNNLGKYRKYHTTKLMDLLRALRNKYHHFNDMPEHLQKQLSPLPHGFYNYFNTKFPHMLMEIYFVVRDNLKEEHVFEDYY